MQLFRLFLLSLLISTSLHANSIKVNEKDVEKLVSYISKVVGPFLYDVDHERIPDVMVPIIKNVDYIDSVEIIESYGNEVIFSTNNAKDNAQVIGKIDEENKSLVKISHTIVYKDNIVGYVNLYINGAVSRSVRIAFSFDKPPYLLGKAHSNGIEIDIVSEAFETMGYEVDIFQSNEDNRQNLFNKYEDLDAISSISISNKNFHISDEYISYKNYLVTKKDKKIMADSISALKKIDFVSWKKSYDDLGDDFYGLFNPVNGSYKYNYNDSALQSDGIIGFFEDKYDGIIIDEKIFKWHKIILNNNDNYTYHNIFKKTNSYSMTFKSKKHKDIFNKGLKKLKKQGRIKQIYDFYNTDNMPKLLSYLGLISDISAKFMVDNKADKLQKILEVFYTNPDITAIQVYNNNKDSFVDLSRKLKENSSSSLSRDSFYFENNSPVIVGKVILQYKRQEKIASANLIPKINVFKSFSKDEKDKIYSSYVKFGFISTDKKENIKTINISFLNILSIEETIFAFFIVIVIGSILYSKFVSNRIMNLNLKWFNILIISFEITVILFLIYEIVILDRTENALAKIYSDKLKIIQVTDNLKQSSNDLTHNARNYAVTNDIKYKEMYLKRLDIRNGIIKRPENDSSIYWNLTRSTTQDNNIDTKKESFLSIVNRTPFSNIERLKIKEVLDNSNLLTKLEIEAFDLMNKQMNKEAINLLYSNKYYLEKQHIIVPYSELMNLINNRISKSIINLEKRIQNQFRYIVIVGLLFLASNIVLYYLLVMKISNPIGYLTKVMKRLQNSEEKVEKIIFYKDEIGLMNDEFFKMHDLIETRTHELEEVNKNVFASINYASIIQKAILPSVSELNNFFEDHFLIWKPKDIVGGDIYFVSKISENELLVMVIDGAGHGVPGAFVTMLVKAINTQIISDISIDKLKPEPSLILEYFNRSLKTMIKDENNTKSSVGFDGSILYYNKKTNICKYSGSQTPLYIVNNGELEVIKSDRQSVGFRQTLMDQEFTQYTVEVKKGTQLYITTDGLLDQCGVGKFGFGKKRFIQSILENGHKELAKQKFSLYNTFEQYKEKEEQMDDITVLALKF